MHDDTTDMEIKKTLTLTQTLTGCKYTNAFNMTAYIDIVQVPSRYVAVRRFTNFLHSTWKEKLIVMSHSAAHILIADQLTT